VSAGIDASRNIHRRGSTPLGPTKYHVDAAAAKLAASLAANHPGAKWAKIEDFLEGFKQPTYRGMGVQQVPGRLQLKTLSLNIPSGCSAE
jgi:hypothetical protein